MINILIVDDHELVRACIKKLLSEEKGLKIIGEAGNGIEALESIKERQPDVVLMDYKMPDMGGIEATKKITQLYPDVKVLALTAYDEDPFPTRFIQAGAFGYLTKDSSKEKTVQAIRAAHTGQRYISPEIAERIALGSDSAAHGDPFSVLSDREQQVMDYIVSGVDSKKIADNIRVNQKTINTYRYRIFKKLKIKNNIELAHLAIRHGRGTTDKEEA